MLAVVTAADFAELPVGATIPMGETGYDMWMVAELNIARHKVHWVGQPVAAVAATDAHVAEAALALIEVDYEPLPAVLDIAAAMAPGAPVLHEHVLTKGIEPRPHAPSNVCSRTEIARGDASRALAQAGASAHVSVEIDTAHQGYLEPQAAVAQVDANGFATVWASTQGQFTAELMIARMLGLPQSQLRVVPLEIGGGFGGKIAIHGEALAVRLAQKCRRPVKLVLTREEVLQGGSGPAAGAVIDIAVGAENDGRLVAIEGTYRMDAGGLPGLSPSLVMQASAALYQCPNLNLVGYDVVTNKPRTEAYRGPGGIQAAFAMEQAMDALCQRLDLDPLEFRKRNASVTGSTMPIGTPFPAIGLTTILDRVGEHACWRDPLPPGRHPRGRGLALGYWRGTSMTSAAHITVAGDGRPMVTMGPVDISGTRTTMAQVVAEEFGLPLADVHIQTGDSKSVGYSDGAAGSRVARTTTAALVEACADALGQLRTRAAEKLQCAPADLDYARGRFQSRQAGGAAISLARTDAGDADRRCRGGARRIDQAAAGRGDRRAMSATWRSTPIRASSACCATPRSRTWGLPSTPPRSRARSKAASCRGSAGRSWKASTMGRTGGCGTQACSTTACPPRSTCRRSTASSSRRRCRTCLMACVVSARCRSCRRPPPSPTRLRARPACACGACR